jgi:prepilin-type processing-associated H-X9-DG protein/prepilin-type N-terminal cleavage/methylation domain-containing protein
MEKVMILCHFKTNGMLSYKSTEVKAMKKRFTLIELLVVVAIIGVLASLLLPSLGRARKSAQQSVCMNKQKQHAIAIQMYAEDNDNYAPMTLAGANSTRWFRILAESSYLNGYAAELRSCPNGVTLTDSNWMSSIAMNVNFGYDYGNWQTAAQLNSTHADETMLLMDSYNVNQSIWSTTLSAEKLLGPDSQTRIARHNNKANVMFLDGHAAPLGSTFLQSTNAGGNNFWQP